MELKRKLARGVAIVAVAAAAGHFVQNASHGESTATEAPKPGPEPTGVQPVSAGPDSADASTPAATVDRLPVADASVADEGAKQLAAAGPTAERVAPASPADPAATETVPLDAMQAESATPDTAEPKSAEAALLDCTPTLDLVAAPGGLVDLTLTAACHADQRVVLSHAGLAVTARTSSTGKIFTRLPALAATAEIEAKFGDGSHVAASIAVPEAATLQRFGVQWQGADGFRIHALESGSGYGQPGDISAANPGSTPAGGGTGIGVANRGYLVSLGERNVDLPLLAEVYTWPAQSGAKVDVLVEAGVTPATCNTELLGETLNTLGGNTWITDLTVAMPGCEAVGDYLVLKNLVLDPKLAAAN